MLINSNFNNLISKALIRLRLRSRLPIKKEFLYQGSNFKMNRMKTILGCNSKYFGKIQKISRSIFQKKTCSKRYN